MRAYAVHIVDTFDQMERELSDGDERGMLHIGASITLGNYELPGVVQRMKQERPSLRLQATVANVDTLKEMLLDNRLDLAMIEAPIEHRDLTGEPFSRDELVLTLRTRTDTYALLLSARSGSARVCLTEESFENPETPPSFCMLMRKHLTGGRLLDVHMEPGDRIVYFDFQCTNEMGDLVRNILCAELMGRYSNLVLVQNGKIIDALKRAGKLHVAEELYIGCAGFGIDIDFHGGEVFALPGIEVGVFGDEIVQHLRVGFEPDGALRGLLTAGGEREHERQGQDK